MANYTEMKQKERKKKPLFAFIRKLLRLSNVPMMIVYLSHAAGCQMILDWMVIDKV